MSAPTDYVKNLALRVIDPLVEVLARHNVSPNTLTTIGTGFTVVAGLVYGLGHIMTAGWILGLTALFDVLDGSVARRSGKSTVFGAFYDSSLDRVADGALMAGLTVFYAANATHHNTSMVVVCLLGIIGTFLISYTRARAESLGINAKVGLMQRPQRIFLLSAPQALFGLFWDGWVLMAIVVLLTATAWITAVQRIAFVYRATLRMEPTPIRMITDPPVKAPTRITSRRAQS
ncbi:MAG: CDP-alcohol phosphatidyltransferase family protein [Gemmatimonadaceae bacterium]|nr:CDP-alcohol phosphatidyltransferase family protein [Gemmatimonadaceae bacterium]